MKRTDRRTVLTALGTSTALAALSNRGATAAPSSLIPVGLAVWNPAADMDAAALFHPDVLAVTRILEGLAREGLGGNAAQQVYQLLASSYPGAVELPSTAANYRLEWDPELEQWVWTCYEASVVEVRGSQVPVAACVQVHQPMA